MVALVVMRPRVVLVTAAVVGVLVVTWALLSPSGMAKLDRLLAEEKRLADDVAQKKAENARLVGDVQRLQGDTEAARLSLEKRARDELGYVTPGEVVLQVPLPASQTAPASTDAASVPANAATPAAPHAAPSAPEAR
jgi:cell division protein FtsB